MSCIKIRLGSPRCKYSNLKSERPCWIFWYLISDIDGFGVFVLFKLLTVLDYILGSLRNDGNLVSFSVGGAELNKLGLIKER